MADTKQNRHIFLSAVSEEFREHRAMLKQDLSLPHVKVMEQTDFPESGGTLLEKLDTYIRRCDAVVQLVGNQVGSMAKPAELRWLTQKYPDFAQRFPFLVDQLADTDPTLSYTQLEAWLALYHRRQCYWYQPAVKQQNSPSEPETSPIEPGTPQFEHWMQLRQLGEDRGTFEDPQHLCRRVLRALHNLFPQDFPAPLARLIYPPLGKLFIGREPFLQDIRARFERARASGHWPNHAVHGLGGVGKTRLVVEYAWRYQDHYAAVLMINAESPESLDRELATLAGVLDSTLDPHLPDPQRLQATRAWLQRHPGWLLLVDNVDTKKAQQAVAARLPDWTAGHVIITARVASWPRGVERLDLHVLTGEDATEFLIEATDGSRVDQPDDKEQAWRLATDDLGGLCLALEQAAAYVGELNISLAEYRRRWQQNEKQVRQWADKLLMRYHEESAVSLSVATTWQTTVDQLQPAARALLEMLSWLAPEPFPRGLLDHEQMQTELQTLAGEDADVELALAELRRYSLVSRANDAEFDAAGQIHRLVQLITRDQLAPTAQATTLTAMLAAINDYTPDDSHDVRTWPVLEPLQPHLAVIVEHADAARIAEPTTRLFNQLGLLLLSKAKYSEAEPLLKRTLTLGEQHLGDDHVNVATFLNNLAQLLQATNRLAEAEPMFRRSLDILERTLGAQHPQVAKGLNNLAVLLQATNRLPDAELMMRRALAILKESLGEEHPDYATSLNGLGILLLQTNRMAEAEPLLRHVAVIYEASLGPDHPWLATALNSLAKLLQATNRLAEAKPLMWRAVEILRASLGDEHPNTIHVTGNYRRLQEAMEEGKGEG